VRSCLAAFVVLGAGLRAQTQFRKRVNLERLNRGLASWVDDYTHNHGQDRRINSPILGRPRDLHVYLPPDIRPAWPTR